MRLVQNSSFPLVSVVIPIFMPGETFLYALGSVRKQRYPNFEIVISDDGDFDSMLLPKDERIKFVSNISSRKGIFSNLNNAICNSRGDFVQIFCQDDIMADLFLTSQVKVLTSFDKAGMIFSSFVDIYNDDMNVRLDKEEQKVVDVRYYQPSFFLNKLFVKGCMPGNLSPVMLRRSVYLDVGEFDASFKYCGDFDYWIRLAQHNGAIYHSSQYLYIRNHPKQASNTLPLIFKIEEERLCYSRLFDMNTIRRNDSALSWYFNEKVGVQHFTNYLRSKNKGQKSRIEEVFIYPFSLWKILLLTVLSLKNRIRLFFINEKDI